MFAADQLVNRFAGLPPDYVTVEYSINNGDLWYEISVLTDTDIWFL